VIVLNKMDVPEARELAEITRPISKFMAGLCSK
jgi:hypothetical protein